MNTARVTGLYFEGFYRDKRTERASLHLHFLYRSTRPPPAGPVRSPSNPTFAFQYATFPPRYVRPIHRCRVPPFFLLLLRFFHLLYTPIIYTAKNTLRVVFYFFSSSKFPHFLPRETSKNYVTYVRSCPYRIPLVFFNSKLRKRKRKENVDSLQIRYFTVSTWWISPANRMHERFLLISRVITGPECV